MGSFARFARANLGTYTESWGYFRGAGFLVLSVVRTSLVHWGGPRLVDHMVYVLISQTTNPPFRFVGGGLLVRGPDNPSPAGPDKNPSKSREARVAPDVGERRGGAEAKGLHIVAGLERAVQQERQALLVGVRALEDASRGACSRAWRGETRGRDVAELRDDLGEAAHAALAMLRLLRLCISRHQMARGHRQHV